MSRREITRESVSSRCSSASMVDLDGEDEALPGRRRVVESPIVFIDGKPSGGSSSPRNRASSAKSILSLVREEEGRYVGKLFEAGNDERGASSSHADSARRN